MERWGRQPVCGRLKLLHTIFLHLAVKQTSPNELVISTVIIYIYMFKDWYIYIFWSYNLCFVLDKRLQQNFITLSSYGEQISTSWNLLTCWRQFSRIWQKPETCSSCCEFQTRLCELTGLVCFSLATIALITVACHCQYSFHPRQTSIPAVQSWWIQQSLNFGFAMIK